MYTSTPSLDRPLHLVLGSVKGPVAVFAFEWYRVSTLVSVQRVERYEWGHTFYYTKAQAVYCQTVTIFTFAIVRIAGLLHRFCKPATRKGLNVGSNPTDCSIFFCERGIMAVHPPSKWAIRVRFSAFAPVSLPLDMGRITHPQPRKASNRRGS